MKEQKRTEESAATVTDVVYPSPVLVAGPLVMAICLVAGGVVRGTLLPRHSTPALLLFALTYLFSRWYRRSAVVFTSDSVSLGDKVIHYADISSACVEKGKQDKKGMSALNIYDKNGVMRVSINLRAYGTGVSRIVTALRHQAGIDALSDVDAASPGKRIYILWTVIGLLSILALFEGFTV